MSKLIFKVRLLLILLSILVACGAPGTGKIELPELDANFYRSALEMIEEEYRKNPSRDLLIQKLYYQEKLNWPEESIQDLKEAERQFGLSRKVIHGYCDYYFKNGRYFELLQAVSIARSLEVPDELTRRYEVIGHVNASKPLIAHSFLRKFLNDYRDEQSIEFGVDQYLRMSDTLMAVYHLNKLQKIDPGNELVASILAPSLINYGYKKEAREVLLSYSKARPEAAYTVAGAYLELGDLQAAKTIYRQIDSREGNLQLVDIFRKERSYDSSIYYLDKVLVSDSSWNLLILKAEILESRGWLTSAYFMYQYLLDQNPEDSIALSHSLNVGRKIAYLRRIKEEEGLAPVSRIEPKELTE